MRETLTRTRQDFRKWLLTVELQADETVKAHMRHLDFHVRDGFAISRFGKSARSALEYGGDWLAERRTSAGNEAYINDVKLFNLLARWKGHAGVKWAMPPRKKGQGPIYQPHELRLVLELGDECGLEGLRAAAAQQWSLATGWRRGEAARLVDEDVLVRTKEYRLQHPGKGGPARTLEFVDPSILDKRTPFMRWCYERPGAEDGVKAIWTSIRRGKPRPLSVAEVGQILFLAGRQVKVKASWHKGRRTFATALRAAGVDISTIQVYLGHTRIETTRQYVHVDRRAIRAELARIRPVLPLHVDELAKAGQVQLRLADVAIAC